MKWIVVLVLCLSVSGLMIYTGPKCKGTPSGSALADENRCYLAPEAKVLCNLTQMDIPFEQLISDSETSLLMEIVGGRLYTSVYPNSKCHGIGQVFIQEAHCSHYSNQCDNLIWV